MTPLTEKQSLFYQCYYTAGSESFLNGPKSAKKAGYSGNNNTLRQRAHELVTKSNAKTEKAKIQAKTGADVEYTVKQYQIELETARIHAETYKQPSAEVSAIVAKGRSMGYDKDNDISSDQQYELDESQVEAAKALAQVMNLKNLRLA